MFDTDLFPASPKSLWPMAKWWDVTQLKVTDTEMVQIFVEHFQKGGTELGLGRKSFSSIHSLNLSFQVYIQTNIP